MMEDDPDLDYLGSQPETLIGRMSLEDAKDQYCDECVQGVFRTAEIAIAPSEITQLLRNAVCENTAIKIVSGVTVMGVEKTRSGFHICTTGSAQATEIQEYVQVVNATWESRRQIDQTLGISPGPGWVYRLKHRVLGKLPEQMADHPSVTMVIGRYGDIVVWPDGRTYLSWYPTCMTGWTHDLRIPFEWEDALTGRISPESFRKHVNGVQAGLGWYRGIDQFEAEVVDAGVIVAYGKTDVDQADSGLHNRSHPGIESHDGYHSVDGGKLTTAPLMAMKVADVVAGAICPAP